MGRIVKYDARGDLNFALSVPARTFLSLPEDEQEDLRVLAMPIFSMLQKDDAEGAKAHLDSLCLDDTYLIAMWSLFSSSQRSAMKKV